jgi:hypothetical protein
MDFLYTSILGAIFAILAVAYIYIRSTYDREVTHKEKFIEYKYKKYKYVLITFIVFLSLTYFVFKIENSNLKRKKTINHLTDLKCLLEQIKAYYEDPNNIVATATFSDVIKDMKNKGKITDDQLYFMDKFYYIDSNVYKPVRSLLDNNKYKLLLNYLKQIIEDYSSSMAKDVFEASSCMLKTLASAGTPVNAGANIFYDITKKDKSMFS